MVPLLLCCPQSIYSIDVKRVSINENEAGRECNGGGNLQGKV